MADSLHGGYYDAIVVGGGPIGGRVAHDIAAVGFRVAVIERDRAIGKPVQCSGLVTRRTLEAARFEPTRTINVLTGAAVHAPSGARYEIGGDHIHGYVLDRSHFDRHVFQDAVAAGVDLHLRTHVTALTRTGTTVDITAVQDGRARRFATSLVIGADGPRSIVADFLQLPPSSEILRARGADVRLPRPSRQHQVQIFVGARYAPGFFAWAIPLGRQRYRIGWGTQRRMASDQALRHLLMDHPDVFGDLEILSQTGGLIPLGPRPRTSGHNGMVVGDAAGQAKPTSGGGLYTGLRCAEHCAHVAIQALTTGDTSERTLRAYDEAWRADIGQELLYASSLRQAYRQLTDGDLEWALRLLNIPGVRRVVNHYGDIDYPSRLAAAVLPVAPSLFGLLGHQRRLLDKLVPDWSGVASTAD